MRKSTLLLILPLLLCGFAPDGEKPDEPPAPAKRKRNATDASQPTIDMYANGTLKVSYFVQVHADPKVGQYWETSSEIGNTKTMTRWQVSKVDSGIAVVENQMKMDSDFMKTDYVIAYQVDLSKKEGEANVTKAWVGRPDGEGKPAQIMEKPKDDAVPGAVEYESKEEAFTDLEAAGRKWSGKLMTMKGQGWESKMWMADNGWFNKMVKMEAAGFATTLSAMGEDAKALLKLPDDKAAEDKEEKKEDGKKEEKKD